MATPSEYANRYKNLQVGFDDGDVNVTIERYHIGTPDDEAERLVQAVREYYDGHFKKDPSFTLDLIVNGQKVSSTFVKMKGHVAAPFWGKGSPEDCQVAAQLAVVTKRTTKENLARYCDQHLGIDCNGLVGNYFFHDRGEQPWESTAKDKVDLGPSSTMDQFVAAGLPVLSVTDIIPANIHLFVELNDQYRVKPGGSGGAGHIMMTDPNKYTATSFVVNSFAGLDLRWAEKGAYGHPALWAIESTGPQGAVGLRESWYAIKRSLATIHTKNRGIYEVFRGSKAENLNCELVAFSPKPA